MSAAHSQISLPAAAEAGNQAAVGYCSNPLPLQLVAPSWMRLQLKVEKGVCD
jgi:hypothetical protein